MDGHKCTRYLLLLLSIIIFLSGATLLATGLLFKLDSGFLDSRVVTLFNTIQYNSLPIGIQCDFLSYMMMCMGAIMVMVSILGMCGALKSVKACLWVFIVLATIFTIVLVVVIGIWISVRTKADLWLRGQMLESLKSYDGPSATDEVSDGWNTLFMQARCCGVNAQFENGGTNSDYTELPTTWTSGTDLVPASCCQGATHKTVDSYINSATCTNTPSNFYTEGCYTRVKYYIDIYSLITFLAAGIAIVAQVIAIVASCVVIDKAKNRVADFDNAAAPSTASRPPPYVAINKWKQVTKTTKAAKPTY